MNKFVYVTIALGAFVGSTFALNCGHSLKGVAPAVVRLAAEDCVEIARMHGDSKTETICAKAEELAPLLDLILAARKKSVSDAGIDATMD